MSVLQRDIRRRRERGRELLGTLHRTELEQAGTARRAAVEEAEAQLNRIAELLPGALNAGLSLVEIARLTGVSRPTLYELQKRSGSRDVQLELLGSLVGGGPQSQTDLAAGTGVSPRRIDPVIRQLISKGWAERLKGSGGVVIAPTKTGEAALREWDFDARFEERTTKTLRAVLDLLRFTPEERADVERKVARAEAEGTERLGFLEAIRMGTEAELARLRGRAQADEV